ncbi:MAG: (Fe-S)-binding protein [Desulfobacterales bacterium]|nr:(Fe-S)-binding protein [Desulfobacterales bacterium]
MSTYIIIKSIFMVMAIIVAFGLFFIRVRHLVSLIKAVEGKSAVHLDRIAERIKVVFTDVLGQSNVRRKAMPGTAHMLIFFGFLAIQPHSLELMINGVIPAFDLSRWIPGLYGVYLFVADILAFLVIIGLVYALYRRLVLKPKYLTNGLDARLIIIFTFVIVVSFHFINALEGVISAREGGFDYFRYLTVSESTATIFNLLALGPVQQRIGFEIFYWIHMFTILGFLVYIPGSKHLHLLAAAPNVFLKPLEREKTMFKDDLEAEDAESFGLGNVSQLSWKSVLDLYACTECGRCEEQCPADATGKPLSPKRVVSDTKHDLFDQSRAILAKNDSTIEPIIREESPVTGDVIWSCTSCRACEDICPVNIQHLDILLETRKYQVLMESAFPPEIQDTFISLENQANPWGFDNDTRAHWCRDMDVALMTDKPDADMLYFVGCAGSFDDRGKKIARAMVRVLQKAGVDFAILGPDESCNGDVARRAGNEYIAQMLIQQNVEILNQYKPKKILTGCPHCYNILKNEYPQFGASYEVVHHTELLLELYKHGRLKASNGNIAELTFHDSCYLGRWNGIYQAPRELLSSLNGNRLIEMPRSKSKGFCCGAGGARMFMEETIGKRINIERAEEIIAIGAKTVAAACPFCVTMLRDGILDKESNVQVKDIVEIIDEAG